ncbi:MAG: NAD(P)/FAD-dependent oxidoreductase [Deltaproteobacteria bacterium]|nr:NAD(P)/FAD-dependent oxidoreductase [Deltaproteobacteria bacterium]
MSQNKKSHYRVVIIGAGSGGLCMAIQLKKAGIEDFVMLEKADGLGGTWWHNTYPGAECDVQSHLYSYSFEQKNDWSKPFAGQAEILVYLNHCADKYDVRRHIQFKTQVASVRWQDDKNQWQVVTSTGETIEAPIVVSALGMFNNLVWPTIPGIHDFQGTYFHSARWNHQHDISGERVGVIGIAASAIQFVPEIAPKVGELHLFQRTANWVVPKGNTPYTAEDLDSFRKNPELVRQSRENIYRTWNTLCTFDDKKVLADIEKAGLERLAEVKDPEVRRKLTPNHPFGCKRPLFSDVYYPVFNRDNVNLITETIEKVTAKGIITVDGKLHEVDTIIYSTGFETTTYLAALDVTGRGGRPLKEAWNDGAQAYLGITTSGFPNLFMLYGPNTNQGSIIFMLEQQVDYIMRQIKRMEAEKLAWIDVRPEVMTAFNNQLQKDIGKVDVWQAQCGNDFYYRSSSGRLVTQWPHSMDAFVEQTHQEDRKAFEVQAVG